MPKQHSAYPGKTQFRQAMNAIGHLIFERGLAGDLDMSVSCRRFGETTTITVLSPDGVMHFTVTDDEIKAERTPRQRRLHDTRHEAASAPRVTTEVDKVAREMRMGAARKLRKPDVRLWARPL